MTDTRAKLRVVIVFAMEAEAAPLLRALPFAPTLLPNAVPLPFRYFRNDGFPNLELMVALNGVDKKHGVDNIGSVPAAVNAFNIITGYQPDLIISAGTAGGFAHTGRTIGEVVLSARHVYFHDRRIPLPGFEEYGVGQILSMATHQIAAALDFPQAVVTSGDSIPVCAEDLAMMQKSQASVKDMEAAAIAWICHETGTPFFAIKAITDWVESGEPETEQFVRNLQVATTNLSEALQKLIALLDRQPELVQ